MTHPVQEPKTAPVPISQLLLESLPDPVLALNLDNKLQVANKAARQLFNLSPAAIGQSIEAVLPADLQQTIATALKGESAEWHTEDGKTIYAVQVQPVAATTNTSDALQMVILQDVTLLKLVHEHYSDFVYTVLHDLRSPLTFMRGFADMLPMVGEVNARQREYINRILSGITQVANLIENSLDAGRLDPLTGFYKLSREMCQIGAVVNEVVASQTSEAEKKHQTIVTDVSPDIPPLWLDSLMVRRALNNLVDNAIKYTPENGTITVRAYLKDDSAFLSVRDTGSGISAADQSMVFGRFQRLRRPEHVRVKGSGLGLFVVKSVAQWHGGNASLESVEGEGSTFTMQLPIMTPPAIPKSASAD